MADLDKVCAKVTDQIKSTQVVIETNLDALMKLNILKGMLLEENLRSKGSEPWIKYMSEHKNLF